MRALCHWHEDIELITIQDGEMNYDVNGHKILLQKGDSIMVNARQMHFGYSHHKKECSFLCILFHPSLLMSHEYTNSLYVKPIIDNPNIEYLVYRENAEVAQLQEQIISLKTADDDCSTLDIISTLFQLWSILYHTCKAQNLIHYEVPQPTDLLIQKKMVSYIYQNYREIISLDDIASAGNVSNNKCCLLFKKYLQQSPIDFANSYRLEVSCNLLRGTKESVSSIAFVCGFNHLSYFSKLFYRKYNCTPSAYRKISHTVALF